MQIAGAYLKGDVGMKGILKISILSMLAFLMICHVDFYENRTYLEASEDAGVLFREGFEDGNFSSRGWYDNTNLILSGSEHNANSSKSVEFHFKPSSTKPDSGAAIRRKFSETESLYVSYYVKYSENWTGSNRSYHPHEFAILTNVDGDWIGPAFTHLTFYIEQNEGEPLLAMQDGRNIDQSRVGADLTGITEDRAVAGCNGDTDEYKGGCYSAGPYYNNGKLWRAGKMYFSNDAGPYYKSNWHFIEVFAELNSIRNGKAGTDGILKYWYDGELIIDHEDVVFRTGQHPDIKFDQFIIAPWIGDGSPVDQTFWVDDLTVATGRFSTSISAPRNLRIVRIE
jgi:hypothetical protein